MAALTSPCLASISPPCFFSGGESRVPQIHAHRLELVEHLARLFEVHVARHQSCHDLRYGALHGRHIIQRNGFKPCLARALRVFSRAPWLLKAMGIAITRAPHGGAAAACALLQPVLA